VHLGMVGFLKRPGLGFSAAIMNAEDRARPLQVLRKLRKKCGDGAGAFSELTPIPADLQQGPRTTGQWAWAEAEFSAADASGLLFKDTSGQSAAARTACAQPGSARQDCWESLSNWISWPIIPLPASIIDWRLWQVYC